jgi:hypothetical protein
VPPDGGLDRLLEAARLEPVPVELAVEVRADTAEDLCIAATDPVGVLDRRQVERHSLTNSGRPRRGPLTGV